MLAAVLHGAHDLRLEDRALAPLAAGEVLVRVAVGGICGSDLSYFRKGGVGDFRVTEPLTLGHEVAGTIVEHGPGAPMMPPPPIGTRVAINPSRPCLACRFCRTGQSHLCRDMRFLGSAARTPHVQGAFSEFVAVRADQCVAVPDHVPFRIAACAEPFAVSLHAIRRAGDLVGRDVLISGAGPIGLLCLIAARLAGAASVVVTDLAARPLETARAAGALAGFDAVREAEALAAHAAALRFDGFDVAIEAAGAAASIAALPALVRRGGRIVQVGMLPKGDVALPVNLLMAREIDLLGSFRFDDEFDHAVALIAAGRVEFAPILSASLPLADANEAFALACDKERAIKVHLEIA